MMNIFSHMEGLVCNLWGTFVSIYFCVLQLFRQRFENLLLFRKFFNQIKGFLAPKLKKILPAFFFSERKIKNKNIL